MNVLDLFSGIGGFSLGLERAGMKTVAFCEVDKKCQQVLKKHWPGVPIFDDVSTLKGEDIEETVDVICGGFPCQDISLAGNGAGLEGKRSGLWSEFHRLIKEIKPKYAIIENVSALRSRGLDQVLREISEIGYDAEWHCITAASIGAPHRRDRIWIVAYLRDNTRRDSITGSLGRDGERELEERVRTSETTETTGSSQTSEAMAYANDNGSHGSKDSESNCSRDDGDKTRQNKSFKLEGSSNLGQNFQGSREKIANVAYANSERLEGQREISSRISEELKNPSYTRWWEIEPSVGRVAHGVSGRVDRLKQLGNAVVPQIPELIGRAICQVG
jgi:DNA (cytosine-5)-methyltransferase 1